MPRNVLRQTRTEKPHSDCRHRSLRTEAFPRVTPAIVSVVFNPCASTSSIPLQSLRDDTGGEPQYPRSGYPDRPAVRTSHATRVCAVHVVWGIGFPVGRHYTD